MFGAPDTEPTSVMDTGAQGLLGLKKKKSESKSVIVIWHQTWPPNLFLLFCECAFNPSASRHREAGLGSAEQVGMHPTGSVGGGGVSVVWYYNLIWVSPDRNRTDSSFRLLLLWPLLHYRLINSWIHSCSYSGRSTTMCLWTTALALPHPGQIVR